MRTLPDSDMTLPFLLRRLTNLWWPLKIRILTKPAAWRMYSSVCRRLGWNETRLGWYAASNGPYAGIRLQATHVNLLWLLLGGYEPWVTKLLVQLLTEEKWGCAGKDVWDVGAYRGYFSLLCSKYGRGRVICFEPDASNRQALTLHLRRNPHLSTRVEIVPAAVADTDGLVEFLRREVGLESQIKCTGVRLYDVGSQVEDLTTITGLRLDSLLEQGRPAPGLIKIDVEGAETLVLRGATELLRRHRPLVLLEIHNEESYHACMALLKRSGYNMFSIEGGRLRAPEGPITYGHVMAHAVSLQVS
jgi:FkbM family methyltransferase